MDFNTKIKKIKMSHTLRSAHATEVEIREFKKKKINKVLVLRLIAEYMLHPLDCQSNKKRSYTTKNLRKKQHNEF